MSSIHIVFDGPPSHESGRFVEVEDESGHSIGVGEWIELPLGPEPCRVPLYALKLPDHRALQAELNQAHAEIERLRAHMNESAPAPVDQAPSTPPPTGGRDPRDRKALEDAFNAAQRLYDETTYWPSPGETFALARGYLILAEDVCRYLEAVREQKHYCGWCERAGISRADLPSFTLDEAAEHTPKCEHNPLVRELAEQRAENARLMTLVGQAMDPPQPVDMRTDYLAAHLRLVEADVQTPNDGREHTVADRVKLLAASRDEMAKERDENLGRADTFALDAQRAHQVCSRLRGEKANMRDEIDLARVEHARLVKNCDSALADAAHLRAESERLAAARDEANRIYRAREAEVSTLRLVLGLAFDVVNERRAKLQHARESDAMCKLAKAVDAYANGERPADPDIARLRTENEQLKRDRAEVMTDLIARDRECESLRPMRSALWHLHMAADHYYETHRACCTDPVRNSATEDLEGALKRADAALTTSPDAAKKGDV
jgi:hypothetical protein